ncbi:MAG TPA: hypothetical protein VN345_16570, partial [Blastocatellia bacterium]|nr:hypothetical protein [Blastocatellia bacterium]
GTVTVPAPSNVIPTYNRYWKVEPDATMARSIIVSVRVVAVTAGRGILPEETTLATIRVF